MTEDTLNIEEIKMHNKTVSKILVAIIMTSMLLAIMPALPVAATTVSSLDPSTGNVGATVRLIGSIDTEGGAYTIWFDLDDDGTAIGDTAVKTSAAPTNSLAVNTTFTIPACVGNDAGNGHKVTLQDLSSGGSSDASFSVRTKRTIVVATHDQEGDVVAINMTVTGGIATTLNNFTLTVTDPAATAKMTYNVSFMTNGLGSGWNVTNYPTAYTTGANTNATGTYTIVADRKLPGVIANAATASFTIGLTDKVSYGRFETVSVKTSGWAVNQNVTITIKNPSDVAVKTWANQNLTSTGVFTGTWVLPWNATLGTYTVTAVNATGNNKAIASTQTFTVTSAAMTVAWTVQPSSPVQRTQTVNANITVQYPDSTYLNTSQFSALTVTVYYNTTVVTTMNLTTSNFNTATNSWRISWTLPRNAVLGTNYKFTVAKNSIIDTTGNSGPTSASSSGTFTVTAAVLTVNLTGQPAANYTRVQPAIATMNITYPDKTYFTAADLGNVTVRVMQGATIVANVTLAASSFNSTTNRWTISWPSGYNATLADYLFTVAIGGVKDAAMNANTAAVSTTAFTLLKGILGITSVNTDKTSYARGEFVRVFFDAAYADGSPVITGTSTVTLTAPDGFTKAPVNPVFTSGGRWQVTWWLSEAQQTGAWNITLAPNGVVDGALPTANTGPAAALRSSFTVLPSSVTLGDIIAAVNALDDRLNDVEAVTSSLGSQMGTLSSTVSNLQGLINTLQTNLNSLSATAATDSDVAAVSAAVNGLGTDIAALETKVNALSTAINNAATDADVAAVSAAVDELGTDIAALETKLNALTSTTASAADLTAATDDLSGQIGGLNTMVIVAVVLALIAAIAAILAVYIIQRKIAG